MFLWVVSALGAEPGLIVNVSGVREGGVVACLLFSSAEGFPGGATKAAARSVGAVSQGVARCLFAGVPQGKLAISVVHDTDGDLTLDTNTFGMPTEGYGFSAGAKAHLFGPPSFEEASFDYDGASREIAVPMVYR